MKMILSDSSASYFDAYYNASTEPLSREEEMKLLSLCSAGDKKARDKIILANIRFVLFYVKRYKGKGIEMDELVTCGIIGLIKAIDHYNSDHGAKLITYATFWIRNEICDCFEKLRNTDSLDEEEKLDCLVDEKNESPEDVAITACFESQVRDSIEALSNQEKEIVKMRYGIGSRKQKGKSFAEIAACYGRTKQWAHGKLQKAEEKLMKIYL